MTEKIKELKNLRIVRECALNYDHVPEECEAEEIIKEMLPSWIKINLKDLKDLLTRYEGNSVDNIDNYIIDAIDEL